MNDFESTKNESLKPEYAEDFGNDLSELFNDINSVTSIYHQLLSLTVYRNLQAAPIVGSFIRLLKAAADFSFDETGSGVTSFKNECKENFLNAWGIFCISLAKYNFLYNLSNGIMKEILYDENIFSVTCAEGFSNTNSSSIKSDENFQALQSLALRDLKVLDRLANLSAESVLSFVVSTGAFYKTELDSLPLWKIGAGNSKDKIDFNGGFASNIDKLINFHAENAFGKFIDNKAFFWRDNQLVSVTNPDPIRLDELKEYAYQKDAVVSNTKAFLRGHKANNVLLYGDRGTGKSSTVKAILNEYHSKKLRLIEIPKSGLHQLPILTEQISKVPVKFIIFVDDLSFSEDDEDFSMLKAVLEGGVSSLPDNVLIYATSNRRHLVKESFSSRKGDEIHRADTIQETVSLSDRFGIVLTYFLPAKSEFLEIVAQMANDEGVDLDREELLKKAESWAIMRGARSPRYAKQFIIDLKAKLANDQA